MSLKANHNGASSNLLKSLEDIKSDEFGDQQITLKQIPQLDGIYDHGESGDEALTLEEENATKVLDQNDVTPFRGKRKRGETPVRDNEVTSIKKRKLGEEKTNLGSEIGIDLIPSVIKKKEKEKLVVSPDHKAKQEAKMKYIQHFVNISMKYSQFLEKKLDIKSSSGGGGSAANNEATSSRIDYPDITKKLKYFERGSLRPYQIEGVTWLTVLFENCINGILADEMGLGKTIQIIALFCHLYERKVNGPFLIVAPLSTLGNWESEFKKFAPQLPVVRLQGNQDERRDQIRAIQNKFILDGKTVNPIVICSYQVPQLEEQFLKRFCWTYIVVDEGHRIKNPDSKLSQELRALNSENRVLLTGTPLQNNIKELWALFNFLMPELFKDIEGFSSLVELEDVKDKDKILENEAQTKIISTIHKVLAPFMLRREKKYVLTDIIPKKEMIIYCPLTDLQKYIYRAILKQDVDKLLMRKPEEPEKTCSSNRIRRNRSMTKINYRVARNRDNKLFVRTQELLKRNKHIIHPQNGNVPVDCPDCPYFCRLTMQNITMMLQKVVNHPYLIWYPLDPKSEELTLYVNEDLIKHSGKLLVLDTLLPKLKAEGHKVLIFSTFVIFMDLIEEFLILRNHNFRRLDGNTKYDDRNEGIQEFMTDPNVFIFLLSTRAGGLGLNLTAADTVIFMDRDWNPMVDLQAQDRCHRIGQTRPVMIYSLIVKNTIDEMIVSCGDMKKRLEKIVIKEGKFKTLKKCPDENELQELEKLLSTEEKLTKIHANGLMYTDNELNRILDRSELIEEMKNNANYQDSSV